MLALYRCDRQAEALEAYHRCLPAAGPGSGRAARAGVGRSTPAHHRWFTNTAASAARFYYENHRAAQTTDADQPTSVPIGLASFAWDFRAVRRFAERDHSNIIAWNTYDRGGHWATHDATDLLVEDIRQFFATLA